MPHPLDCPPSSLLNAQCPAVAASIKTCQARGKKVVMSLGGAAGVYGFTSNADAQQYAQIIWQMFLGGTAPGWPRPFGDAVLDGIDLDIEGGSATGYAAFVTALRALYTDAAANPSGRKFLITGAPQCPFPVRSRGACTGLLGLCAAANASSCSPCSCHIGVCMPCLPPPPPHLDTQTHSASLLAHGTWQDVLMGEALSKSWFDYVWVQVRARQAFCWTPHQTIVSDFLDLHALRLPQLP